MGFIVQHLQTVSVTCVVKHHVIFPEERPTLANIMTKYPGSSILGLPDSSDLGDAQTGTRSGDVRARTTVQEQVRGQLIVLPICISLSEQEE
jgi:hypothetical protein